MRPENYVTMQLDDQGLVQLTIRSWEGTPLAVASIQPDDFEKFVEFASAYYVDTSDIPEADEDWFKKAKLKRGGKQ